MPPTIDAVTQPTSVISNLCGSLFKAGAVRGAIVAKLTIFLFTCLEEFENHSEPEIGK